MEEQFFLNYWNDPRHIQPMNNNNMQQQRVVVHTPVNRGVPGYSLHYFLISLYLTPYPHQASSVGPHKPVQATCPGRKPRRQSQQ